MEDTQRDNTGVQIAITKEDPNNVGAFFDGSDIFGEKSENILKIISSEEYETVEISIFKDIENSGDMERTGYTATLNKKGEIELVTDTLEIV